MAERVFLDTNVVVYCHDDSAPEKRARSAEILEGDDQLVVSTQVLQEFYVTVTRKLSRALSETDAERAVQDLAALTVVRIDTALVLAAVATSRRHRMSLWDALILQAALAGGCRKVLTEDLQDGFELGSVRVENPFR